MEEEDSSVSQSGKKGKAKTQKKNSEVVGQ